MLAGAPGCQQWNFPLPGPLPVRSSRGEEVRFALNTYWAASPRLPRAKQVRPRRGRIISLTWTVGCSPRLFTFGPAEAMGTVVVPRCAPAPAVPPPPRSKDGLIFKALSSFVNFVLAIAGISPYNTRHISRNRSAVWKFVAKEGPGFQRPTLRDRVSS